MVTSANAWEPKNENVRNGSEPLVLHSALLTESSGLAFSHIDPKYVWSHNDSGGKARLFAFDGSGRCCGRLSLVGVKAIDWEDMASFTDERPRIMIADVGDNNAVRSSVTLYLFDEPNPRKKTKIDSYQKLVVRYCNGAQNCEAVAVDVDHRRILLLGKNALSAVMHEVDLPKPPISESDPTKVVTMERETKAVAQVSIPLATGMDVCCKTGDLWVTGYFHAFHFPVGKKKRTLQQRLHQVPAMIELPLLKQVEAIAVDDTGKVWITSEGTPAKMQRVTAD